MRTVRLVQAVGFGVVLVVAASCAASKEYTSKLFTPRNAVAGDTQAVALRFLDLDNVEPNKENWVTTDIIMGRDTASNTIALDKFSNTYPAKAAKKDTTIKSELQKVSGPSILAKSAPVESEPVARNLNPGEVREKKTRE
jgi:hypothetical protein